MYTGGVNKKKVITHSGSFHADDVFAIAAFQLLLGKENIEVIRTRDESVITSGDYVVDVGGVYDHESKRYDHHQPGAPVRENGIPYAGFGLMWRHYGEEICGSKEVAQKIEEKYVLAIDASDNAQVFWETNELGVSPLEWDDIVKLWRADDSENEDMDTQFFSIVAVVRVYLERIVRRQQKKLQEQVRADAMYEAAVDKSIIVSDTFIARSFFIKYPETNVVVFPRTADVEAGWVAVAVQVDEVGYKTKVQFPESWAGLHDEPLREVSGMADAVFTHGDRYMFIAKSKESAIAAAKLAK